MLLLKSQAEVYVNSKYQRAREKDIYAQFTEEPRKSISKIIFMNSQRKVYLRSARWSAMVYCISKMLLLKSQGEL